MRSNVYRTYLVVNKDGHYIKSPYSRCSCAADNLFCAHMLDLMCVCRPAKKNPTWTRTDFAKKMPTNAEQLQRLVIPVQGLMARNMNSHTS